MMDCLKAQEILSEALDHDVDAASLAEARSHCEGCADCARLEQSLEVLARATTPAAPVDLVERLVALAAKEALLIRAAAAEAAENVTEPSAGVPVVTTTRVRWTPRLTAFASIAAVLLVALVATGIGLGGLLSTNQTASDSTRTSAEYGDTTIAPLTDPGAESGSAGASKDALSAVAAPPYVVLDGVAYAPTGQRAVSPSTLVTATSVATAFDSGTEPVAVPTFRITGETGAIVLRTAPDTYLGFSTVVRQLLQRRFVLTSGSDIPTYGIWPVLPRRFAIPTSPDGSPSFSFFGKDDSGVLVYIPAGSTVQDGFAVAPGTAPDDPAAGNPNWTWWEPE